MTVSRFLPIYGFNYAAETHILKVVGNRQPHITKEMLMRYRSDYSGIYIHIPFCIRKCNYCAFLSSPCSREIMDRYVDCICRELVLRRDEVDTIDTVFLGGGTPSLLEPDQIERILDTLREQYRLSGDEIEITMEANPATLTLTKLKGYLQAGVNRLSIGVQSFSNDRLKVLGRLHDADTAISEFHLAREAGFDNINIDLMFSTPGSSIDEVISDIRTACELGPDHISFYSLQLEPGTPFFEAFERDELREIPDDIDREMYHQGIRYLEGHGYEQYEISNFCRDGKLSKHNYKYWGMNDYLGIGLGASSFIKGRRLVNVSDINEYMDMVEGGELPVDDIHVNTEMDRIGEASFTGLRRREGILFSEILGSKEAFMAHYRNVWDELLEFRDGGFLVIDDEGMRLTVRGFDVSNRIMALLV